MYYNLLVRSAGALGHIVDMSWRLPSASYPTAVHQTAPA
jgi:hypothetical protein